MGFKNHNLIIINKSQIDQMPETTPQIISLISKTESYFISKLSIIKLKMIRYET